ncbi:MAG: M56 family metallopeptidase [Bacteroidota bacterium]
METWMLYTLKSSVCLAAGYLLYYMLLRHETFHRFKRVVLLGIIVMAILVPLIRIQVAYKGIALPVQKLESVFAPSMPVVAAMPESAPVPVISPQKHSPSLLVMLYLAGAVIQLLLILFSISRILVILGKSKTERCRGIRVALYPGEVVPFCFGRWIILSDRDYRSHGDEIILHEQTHLRAGHGLDLLLTECYLAVTWFNPFSWFIRFELKQNHEFEADRNVIKQGVDVSDYQLLLVRSVAGETRFNLANQFNQHNLKTRLTMMNKQNSRPGALLKALLFIPLIALMVQVFAQKQMTPPQSGSKDHPAAKYLELNPDQLALLGFECQPSGLYYKNIRHGSSDKGTTCLYFTAGTYSASIILHPGEQITGHSQPEKILKKQALTTHDFYPVVVAGFNGNRTLDMIGAEKDPAMKLLPVQVNMAALNLGKRADTLVFWFKPTPDLTKMLSSIAKVDDYLQSCPADPAEARHNIKK